MTKTNPNDPLMRQVLDEKHRQLTLPADFTQRVMDRVTATQNRSDTPSASVSQSLVRPRERRQKMLRWMVAAAACLLIVGGAGWLVVHGDRVLAPVPELATVLPADSQPTVTEMQPELLLAETEAAAVPVVLAKEIPAVATPRQSAKAVAKRCPVAEDVTPQELGITAEVLARAQQLLEEQRNFVILQELLQTEEAQRHYEEIARKYEVFLAER
ncbi:MAG: hypothetical protein HUK02_10395 [Bacteroidaceae bacterium]|nr:hypothetical protein [Bacteroidaceae bacterium]